MTAAARYCRVLTPRTINGRACRAGDLIELEEPTRSFLIEHEIVELSKKSPTIENREPDGPPF